MFGLRAQRRGLPGVITDGKGRAHAAQEAVRFDGRANAFELRTSKIVFAKEGAHFDKGRAVLLADLAAELLGKRRSGFFLVLLTSMLAGSARPTACSIIVSGSGPCGGLPYGCV